MEQVIFLEKNDLLKHYWRGVLFLEIRGFSSWLVTPSASKANAALQVFQKRLEYLSNFWSEYGPISIKKDADMVGFVDSIQKFPYHNFQKEATRRWSRFAWSAS